MYKGMKMGSETIAIASDHAGLDLKAVIIKELKAAEFKILDFGTNSDESVDYSDYAYPLAKSINENKISRGILICGSGIGMSIAANRFPRIRAALVQDPLGAQLCRQHNNANIICLGARTTEIKMAINCLEVFLKTEFQEGRHTGRIKKLCNPPNL
jgi:ribose 5-phosphate isomerase B